MDEFRVNRVGVFAGTVALTLLPPLFATPAALPFTALRETIGTFAWYLASNFWTRFFHLEAAASYFLRIARP